VTILVTGFQPFGEHQVNPSALIVEHLARTAPADIICEVLPTQFIAAEERIRELLRLHTPAVLIALGVAPSATELRLERQAINLDDARLPDNAGYQPTATPIVPGGNDALFATLPLEDMLSAVRALGVPVTISDDAGRYVCNHVMYAALDEILKSALPTRGGFIHVPLCTETSPAAISLPQAITAIQRCIAQATLSALASA
jgi:pyroglutamyl-peptidase